MERIAVERLRVGLWVSMEDVPGTGFLLRSEAQIATFVTLGITHVWHESARSEAEPLPEPVPVPEPASQRTPVPGAASDLGAALSASSPGPRAALDVEPGSEPACAAEPATIEAGNAMASSAESRPSAFDEEPAVAPPADALDAQRQSLDRCERRFSAVSRTFRNVLLNVRAQPEEAHALAAAEIGGMVRVMQREPDVAIRLLSEKAGQETALHAINVSVLSVLLARSMGFDEAFVQSVGLGALLHDIGKIELPDVMRGKGDSTNPTERRMFQSHVEYGRVLAGRMGLPEAAFAAVVQHHEATDGSGFPQGLRNDALHPAARIVALVNHYDNLCNPPNPIHALTPHEAIASVYRKANAAFDADTLNAFVRMMGIYPPGSVLQLSDGRFALSVAVDPANAMKPRVIIHDPAVPADEALVVALAERPELSIRRAIKPQALPRTALDYLKPRKRASFFIESRPLRA